MESLEALANYLMSEARTTERGSDQAKKVAKEHVPGDRIKDPAALAREFRWRVRLACGYASDEEGHARRKAKPVPSSSVEPVVNGASNGSGSKRKREDAATESVSGQAQPLFKNFKPKKWDIDEEAADPPEVLTAHGRKPDDNNTWSEQWREWNGERGDGSSEAKVRRRREVLVRVRRTGKGLERQRIERVVEEWSWAEEVVEASSNAMVVDGAVDSVELITQPVEVKAEDAMATDS